MQSPIQPVLVSRGVTADALNFYTNNDDQVTSATWFYHFGNFVTTPGTPAVVDEEGNEVTPATAPDTSFKGIDNQIGNLSMTGADYAAWNGTAEAAKAWVLAQLQLQAA